MKYFCRLLVRGLKISMMFNLYQLPLSNNFIKRRNISELLSIDFLGKYSQCTFSVHLDVYFLYITMYIFYTSQCTFSDSFKVLEMCKLFDTIAVILVCEFMKIIKSLIECLQLI